MVEFGEFGQVERNLMENGKIGNNGPGGKKFDGKWENCDEGVGIQFQRLVQYSTVEYSTVGTF